MTDRELMTMAREASMNAYVPYSRFPVGAAIECADGSVYTGCNVENAALGSTICAERTQFPQNRHLCRQRELVHTLRRMQAVSG